MNRVDIRRDRAADQDLRDQYCFYEESDVDLAERFLDAAEETFSLLATQPEMGSPRHFAAPELAGMRFLPVSGFPRHLIFYTVGDDAVWIVRVLHASRDLPPLLGNST